MKFFSRQTRRIDSGRRSLVLEQLEERRVLSTFNVINTDDSGAGSLRQAILDANNQGGADIIQFDSGVAGTITLTTGELAITDAVDLQGPGAGVVTVSGNNISRVFNVSATAAIRGLTITGGYANEGAGIYNQGTLTVDSSTLSGNSAGGDGGGIINYGTLTLDSSILSGNTAGHAGGGFFNHYSGTMTVDSSTLSANSAAFQGGGISNLGTLTVDSSTLSTNSAYTGGGIFNMGTGSVDNSTFGGNSAALYGGGIANGVQVTSGTMTVQNSTFSGNSANFGGGILNQHAMTVDASTFSGNSAGTGGGILNNGTLTVDSSTLSGNYANIDGGGINNGGALSVLNSTLSGNTASQGGGIRSVGTLIVNNTTISGNSVEGNVAPSGRGGGIYTRGTSTLDNTLVAANFHVSGRADDIDGALASGSSHNLIGVDTNLTGIVNGTSDNQVGTAAMPINPMLGALQDNGGPTQTMALLPGSPAINAGDNSVIPAGVTTDQRGVGYARIDGGTVDIGAYEYEVVNDPPAILIVNTLADTVDADSAVTSLREAILAANDNLGADIIRFASGLTGTIALTSGELAISDDFVDIQGPGADVITVSGNNASRVFYITANATISGLTISGGNSTNGGGIYNHYGTLSVQSSTLSGNSADNGGGIYNAYGTLTVEDSILSGNSSSGVWYYGPGYYGGGGIYNANYGTFSVVRNTSLSDNSAAFAGGGINNVGLLNVEDSTLIDNSAHDGGGLFNWGTLNVVNSTLSDNRAGGVNGSNGAGGGIFNFAALFVEGSTLRGNSASYQGGGIYNRSGCSLTVGSSTFAGNTAWYYGGGIDNDGGMLAVDNSTFRGNSATFGGGIYNYNPTGTATVHGSTLSDNWAPNSGGGIFNGNGGLVTVDSSTLSGNLAGYGGGIANGWSGNGGALAVQNSTLSGNSSGQGAGILNHGALVVNGSTLSVNQGVGIYCRGSSTLANSIVATNFGGADIDGTVEGNSSHNLIGVDTNLTGIVNGTSDNQVGTAAMPINPMLGALQDNGGPTQTMALLPGSPAINAGDNSVIPAGVTTDQRGVGYARIDGGTVDIGVYEYEVVNDPPAILIVNTLADTVDADSAVTSLREAILAANDNLGADIIRFASGLTGTIALTSGELAISDDFVDIQGPGADVITVSGNNASRVFYITANATISGLTISGGNSTNGGGIYNHYGTLSVQSSTLSGNSADNGGGIYNAYGTLTVEDSILSGNSSSGVWYYGPGYYGGGGIYNANYGTFSVVRNTSLSDNSAAFAGGGINNVGLLNVEDSTLIDNSAASEGGGLFNWGAMTVAGTTISGNSADHSGGGILNFNVLNVDGSVLSGNSSYQGGGIYNRGASTLTVVRSIFSGNSASLYGGAILSDDMLTVDNSTFTGNVAPIGAGINNNQNAAAIVRGSTFSGNAASSTGGAFFNSGTLILNSSTLANNSAGYGGSVANYGGALTAQNSTFSGNSSYRGGGIYNYSSGALTFVDSTLSGNSASDSGGGIFNSSGTIALANSIVAANFNGDIHGAVSSSSSHNLVGVDTSLSGIIDGSNGNQVGTADSPINPMLGSLQDNGGPTATMALLLGSPAINAGDNSLIPAGVTTDQRGVGYARIENGVVDIGAYEIVLNRPPVANADNYTTHEDQTLSGNVLANDSDPDDGQTLTVVEMNGSAANVGQSIATAHGTVTLHADGSFVFTPGLGCGVTSDSFNYTISDGLGGSATATVSIAIAQYAGVSTLGGILRVGGGSGQDVITVSGGSLIVNGTPHPLAGVSEVRLWGYGGDDRIDLSGLGVKAFIDGGEGSDTLTGGSADDVIFGRAGDDTITGAAGNDFLIGGTGQDRIVGSAGNDILVAGEVDCELDLDALRAISQVWASSHTIVEEAVDNLLDEVLSDVNSDQLTGGAGADLFIINWGDTITDFQFGKPKTNKDGDMVIRDGVVAT